MFKSCGTSAFSRHLLRVTHEKGLVLYHSCDSFALDIYCKLRYNHYEGAGYSILALSILIVFSKYLRITLDKVPQMMYYERILGSEMKSIV